MANNTSVDTNPPSIQVLTTETIPITLEWEDLVGIGNTVSSPSGVLYDNANNQAVPNGFVNNYGANGTQAQYIFDGSKLQAGHTYTAILTALSAGQTFKVRVAVSCPR